MERESICFLGIKQLTIVGLYGKLNKKQNQHKLLKVTVYMKQSESLGELKKKQCQHSHVTCIPIAFSISHVICTCLVAVILLYLSKEIENIFLFQLKYPTLVKFWRANSRFVTRCNKSDRKLLKMQKTLYLLVILNWGFSGPM